MKPFLLVLLFSLSACHSSKRNAVQQLDIQKTTYQKYIPGESGGKGVLFSISLKQPTGGLDINSLTIDNEELKFSINIKEDIIQLEASRFYADPDRDPEAGGNRDEFETAALFHNTKHQATIQYTLSGKSGSQIINDFEEIPMQIYP